VDDGSTDDTQEKIAAEFPSVNLLHTRGRCGPAFARNVGLREATGAFVLFLDSDTEFPDANTLRRAVEMLEADEGIGLLGGEIGEPENRPDEAYGRNVRFNGGSYRVVARPGAPVDCDYLATCNCLGRRAVMQQVGGFDPYYVFGGEDLDFGTRVRATGLRCVACHEAAVLHRRSPGGRNPDETYRYHKTRVRSQVKLAGPCRLAAGFAADIAHALLFYCLLPLKLLVKLVRRRKLRRENVTGGWLLVKAWLANCADRRETVRCRDADFLSDDELDRYARWNRGEGAA
jgi:GT2 family glycosyltransferase